MGRLRTDQWQDIIRPDDTIAAGEEHHVPPQPVGLPIPASLIAGGVVAFLIGALFLIGLSGGHREQARVIQPTAAPAALVVTVVMPTVAATPVPDCRSAEGQLTIIEAKEAAGDFSGASADAEAALRIAGLCADDRRTLQHKAISAGLSALYSVQFEPLDVPAQQHLVDRYESLRARAQDAGIPIDTDLQIARRAYTVSQFPLAKAALDNAYTAGQFNPSVDRELTQLYVSTCYNLGAWYTTAAKESDRYRQGLAWLRTSERLAAMYRTGQGEAAMKLRALSGSDETAWPSPAVTALLSPQAGQAGAGQ